jgi:hypothetical protein
MDNPCIPLMCHEKGLFLDPQFPADCRIKDAVRSMIQLYMIIDEFDRGKPEYKGSLPLRRRERGDFILTGKCRIRFYGTVPTVPFTIFLAETGLDLSPDAPLLCGFKDVRDNVVVGNAASGGVGLLGACFG